MLQSRFLALALFFAATAAPAQKTLFWMGNGVASVQSFYAHKNAIDTIEPTWYHIDQSGLVTGEPQPNVLKAAKDAHIAVIPLFAIFDHEQIHALVNDAHAQDEMNRAFLRECAEHAYDGINLDIEDVMWTDRDALSALVRKTAALLHAQHLQVQIDVVPNSPGHAGETAYSKWIFEEWRLGYDLKALAESVDLICLMTYDQHTHWTTPGPVGGYLWTKENLDYALHFVPKNKLSLGIAIYGYHWYTGDPGLDQKTRKPNVTADYIAYPAAALLHDTYDAHTQWDDVDHTPWFWFYRDQMREYVYYTDKRAFADRYALAKQSGIAGICSWDLGDEDPSIWDAIPAAPNAR